MKFNLSKIFLGILGFLFLNCTVAQAQLKESDLSNKITIERLVIDGSSLTSKINSILSSYLNQTISLDELSTIQRIINQFYQSQGYLSSFAIIPIQNFEGGIVKIQVVEGRINQYRSYWQL